MMLYRLCKQEYCHDLSGKGAEQSGGRWNSKGVAMIYTSGSRALCMAEIAVHIPISLLPSDYMMVSIEIPQVDILEIEISKLQESWKSFPPSDYTQKIGDKFVYDNEFLCMRAPSVVVQGDYNFLLNPFHKDFRKVEIISTEAFEFDTRLFR